MTDKTEGMGAPSRAAVIIDDDDFILSEVSKILRESDWSVTCFQDGEEALLYLQQARLPEVLIVDNRMPRIDGVDVLEQLILDAGLKIPRAYLCSGVQPPAYIRDRIERLGVHFLPKDTLLDKNEFLKVLEQGTAA